MATDYKPLKTVFHQSRDGKRAADQMYVSRFTSPSSLHWDFSVGENPLFATKRPLAYQLTPKGRELLKLQ